MKIIIALMLIPFIYSCSLTKGTKGNNKSIVKSKLINLYDIKASDTKFIDNFRLECNQDTNTNLIFNKLNQYNQFSFWYNKSQCELILNNHAMSLHYLYEAKNLIKNETQKINSLNLEADINQRLGNLAIALNLYQQSLKIKTSKTAQLNIAYILLGLNHFNDLKKHLKTMSITYKNDTQIKNHISLINFKIYIFEENYPQAYLYYSFLDSKSKQSTLTQIFLAYYYVKTNQMNSAKEILDRQIDNSKSDQVSMKIYLNDQIKKHLKEVKYAGLK